MTQICDPSLLKQMSFLEGPVHLKNEDFHNKSTPDSRCEFEDEALKLP